MSVYRKSLRPTGYSSTFPTHNRIDAFYGNTNKQLQHTPLILDQAKYDIPGQITDESISNCSSKMSQYDDYLLRRSDKKSAIDTLHRFVASTPYTANDLIEGMVRFNRRRQRANFASCRTDSICRLNNSASRANRKFPIDKSIQTSESLTHFQNIFENLSRKRIKEVFSTEFQKPVQIPVCTSLASLHSNEIHSEDMSRRLPRLPSYPSGWKDMNVIQAKYGRRTKSIGTTVDKTRLEILELDKHKRMSKSDDVLWNRYIVREKKNNTSARQTISRNPSQNSLINKQTLLEKESQLLGSNSKVEYVCGYNLKTKVRNYSGQDGYRDENGEKNILYESDKNDSDSQSDEEILSTIKLECDRLTVRCGKQRDRLHVECTPFKFTNRTLFNSKNKNNKHYNTSDLQEINYKTKDKTQGKLCAKQKKLSNKSHRRSDRTNNADVTTGNQISLPKCSTDCSCESLKSAFRDRERELSGDRNGNQFEKKNMQYDNSMSSKITTCCYCGKHGFLEPIPNYEENSSFFKNETRRTGFDGIPDTCIGMCKYPSTWKMYCNESNNKGKVRSICCPYSECSQNKKYASKTEETYLKSQALRMSNIEKVSLPPGTSIQNPFKKGESLNTEKECLCNYEINDDIKKHSLQNSYGQRETLNKDQECFCDYEIYDETEKLKQRDVSLKRLHPNIINSSVRRNLDTSLYYRSRNASRSLDRYESTIDNSHRYIGPKCIFDCNCKSVTEPVNKFNKDAISTGTTHSNLGESKRRYSSQYRASENGNDGFNGNSYDNGYTHNSLVEYGHNNRNEVLTEKQSRTLSNKYCNNRTCHFKDSIARDSRTKLANNKNQHRVSSNSKYRLGFLKERPVRSDYDSSSSEHDTIMGQNCDNNSCICRKETRNKISTNSQTIATKQNDNYVSDIKHFNDQSRNKKSDNQAINCDNPLCINKHRKTENKNRNITGNHIDEQPLIKCDDISKSNPKEEIIHLENGVPDRPRMNRNCHDHNCPIKNYKREQTKKEIIDVDDSLPDSPQINKNCHNHNCPIKNYKSEQTRNDHDRNLSRKDFDSRTCPTKNNPNINKNAQKKIIHKSRAQGRKSESETDKTLLKKKHKIKTERQQFNTLVPLKSDIINKNKKSNMQSGDIRNKSVKNQNKMTSAEECTRIVESEPTGCCDCNATSQSTFFWDKSNKPKLNTFVDLNAPYLNCNICSLEIISANNFQNRQHYVPLPKNGISQNNTIVQNHPPNQLSCEPNVDENILHESHCSSLVQEPKSPELCSCDFTTCSNIQTMDKIDYSLNETENRAEPYDNDVKVIYDSSSKFSKTNDVDSFDFICQNKKKPSIRCSISRTFGYDCCDIKPIKKAKAKRSKKNKSGCISKQANREKLNEKNSNEVHKNSYNDDHHSRSKFCDTNEVDSFQFICQNQKHPTIRCSVSRTFGYQCCDIKNPIFMKTSKRKFKKNQNTTSKEKSEHKFFSSVSRNK